MDNPSRPMLHQRLLDWESNLPKVMHFQASASRNVMFLVGMLHMAYKFVIDSLMLATTELTPAQ